MDTMCLYRVRKEFGRFKQGDIIGRRDGVMELGFLNLSNGVPAIMPMNNEEYIELREKVTMREYQLIKNYNHLEVY